MVNIRSAFSALNLSLLLTNTLGAYISPSFNDDRVAFYRRATKDPGSLSVDQPVSPSHTDNNTRPEKRKKIRSPVGQGKVMIAKMKDVFLPEELDDGEKDMEVVVIIIERAIDYSQIGILTTNPNGFDAFKVPDYLKDYIPSSRRTEQWQLLQRRTTQKIGDLPVTDILDKEHLPHMKTLLGPPVSPRKYYLVQKSNLFDPDPDLPPPPADINPPPTLQPPHALPKSGYYLVLAFHRLKRDTNDGARKRAVAVLCYDPSPTSSVGVYDQVSRQVTGSQGTIWRYSLAWVRDRDCELHDNNRHAHQVLVGRKTLEILAGRFNIFTPLVGPSMGQEQPAESRQAGSASAPPHKRIRIGY